MGAHVRCVAGYILFRCRRPDIIWQRGLVHFVAELPRGLLQVVLLPSRKFRLLRLFGGIPLTLRAACKERPPQVALLLVRYDLRVRVRDVNVDSGLDGVLQRPFSGEFESSLRKGDIWTGHFTRQKPDRVHLPHKVTIVWITKRT